LNDVVDLAANITGTGSFYFRDIDSVRLTSISVAGDLTIAAAGAITQSSTDGITVGGVSLFTTGASKIQLNSNTLNYFGGAVSAINTLGGIQIANLNDESQGLVLGTITAGGGGNLILSTKGAISQLSDTAIQATGTAYLEASDGSIILENSGNDFSGTLTLRNSGANSISVSDANSLTIGTLQMASFDEIPVATDWGSALATIDTASGSSTYGQVTALTLTNPGAGYATTPTVTINGGSGSGATGTVTVDLDTKSAFYGKVTGITLTSGGSGYTFAPAVTLGTAVTLRAGVNEAQSNLDPIILNFTPSSSSYQIPGAMVLAATSENNPTLAQLNLPGGGLTVGTGYSSFETSGSIVVSAPIQSGGYLNMKSETLNWDGSNIISAVQAVQLQPYRTGNELTQGPSVSIDLAGPLPGDYGVTAAQLQALDVSGGMVIVGNSKSTGGINIGATGAVNLSGINYSLGLAGLSGGVNFYDTLTLPAGSTFDLNTGLSVVNGFTTVDPSISKIPDIKILNGTLSFSSSGGVGSLGQFLYTNVGSFGASAITGSVYLDNSTAATDTVITGAFTVSGSNSDFNLISGGGITAHSAVVVGGQSFFTVASGSSADFVADNSSNGFSGLVTLAGPLGNVTINNSGMSLSLADLNISGNFWSQVTKGALVLGNTVVSGIFPLPTPPPPSATANFDVKAVGISASSLIVGGTTRLEAGTGDISLISSANDFGDIVTIKSSANTSLFMPNNTSRYLGAVQATGTFLLSTFGSMVFPWDGLATGNFDLKSSQLSNFNVGTFSASASSDITLPQNFSFAGIPNLILTAGGSIQSTGAIQSSRVGMNAGSSIDVSGAIYSSNLNVTTGTYATLLGRNKISNLGNVVTSAGNFSFLNVQGLNLAGTVSVAGTADLTVAGQFYNSSGQALPFAGTTGRAVVRSLSMMGGLPNQISALAGFTPSYNFTDPGTSRAMIYAVSPLAQFAPNGTTIAGVDLGGTQTGGGQFNTFLTGSDNLNWMISDFGRFDMPTVKPSGMDYILYPQRVEPETKTLPAATLGQLERELGRPPTLEEIQAREVAVREAAMVRSGAILERSSFDAVEDEVEDEVDKRESAEVPVQVIDGGKPQAGGPSVAPAPLSGGAMEGLGPQARKTQSVKQGANGPILRSGPIRSVAHLRPAEPSQSGNISESSAQALKLDAKSVMEQERASAEVGIAPPIASGR
jgi:hypothetical protein